MCFPPCTSPTHPQVIHTITHVVKKASPNGGALRVTALRVNHDIVPGEPPGLVDPSVWCQALPPGKETIKYAVRIEICHPAIALGEGAGALR